MRKVAFLVGNDTFPTIPSLRFPQNDVNDLAEILGDRETCGFETKLYLNKSSQTVLGDFEETSQGLEEKDTILFYYAGHGILRGTELCLASIETKNKRHGATSIEAKKVLEFLRESNAKRRVLILDCCYSGAIGTPYRGGNAEDALTASAHSSGTCILTASTAIQRAAERENEEQTDRQKGNGVFTKALIDCASPARSVLPLTTCTSLLSYASGIPHKLRKNWGNKKAYRLKSEILSRSWPDWLSKNESNLFHLQLHFRTNA